MEQCIYKLVCIKFLQIVDALAHADVFDRNIKLGLDGNGDTALCSSVQLRQNDTGDICHFRKLSCLLQRILAVVPSSTTSVSRYASGYSFSRIR